MSEHGSSDEQQNQRQDYGDMLNDLFDEAFSAAPFDTICSLLRVGGMADANWDPFEESRHAFDDFNWILERTMAERGEAAGRRVGLLMYCQAVEMTAPHEIVANLLRSLAGQGYCIKPFADLVRTKKGKPFVRIPPSATQKFRRIKELAKQAGYDRIAKAVDGFFDDRIRNAFSHSDYILTDKFFRFTEGGIPQQLEVAVLDQAIAECFAFYGSFIALHRGWLRSLARCKKYYRWPNFEVLELLSSEEDGLYGFQVHFSNGSRATYKRQSSGIVATNIAPDRDGTLDYWVGPLEKMEPIWKIDGKPVDDWDALP